MTFRMTVGSLELLDLVTAAFHAHRIPHSVGGSLTYGGTPPPEWYVYAEGYPSPYERTLPVRPSPR